MTNVDKFIDMVRHSDNIVFFGGAAYRQKAAFPISAASTAYIIRNISTRLKRS